METFTPEQLRDLAKQVCNDCVSAPGDLYPSVSRALISAAKTWEENAELQRHCSACKTHLEDLTSVRAELRSVAEALQRSGDASAGNDTAQRIMEGQLSNCVRVWNRMADKLQAQDDSDHGARAYMECALTLEVLLEDIVRSRPMTEERRREIIKQLNVTL